MSKRLKYDSLDSPSSQLEYSMNKRTNELMHRICLLHRRCFVKSFGWTNERI